MTSRNLAALMLFCIAALTQTNTGQAQEPFIGTDGCADLAKLVYAEVTEATWYGTGGFRSLHDKASERQIKVCHRTTTTVSKAFVSAMASIGEPIRWGQPSIGPGDVCLSIFLDQCYPDRNRLGSADKTWSAIRSTIKQAMPNGIATDQSIFKIGTLRSALRFALLRQSESALAIYNGRLSRPGSQMR